MWLVDPTTANPGCGRGTPAGVSSKEPPESGATVRCCWLPPACWRRTDKSGHSSHPSGGRQDGHRPCGPTSGAARPRLVRSHTASRILPFTLLVALPLALPLSLLPLLVFVLFPTSARLAFRPPPSSPSPPPCPRPSISTSSGASAGLAPSTYPHPTRRPTDRPIARGRLVPLAVRFAAPGAKTPLRALVDVWRRRQVSAVENAEGIEDRLKPCLGATGQRLEHRIPSPSSRCDSRCRALLGRQEGRFDVVAKRARHERPRLSDPSFDRQPATSTAS